MTILEILANRGIDYVEHGPNVKKGFIAVHCPWCGDADPSHHMNLHPIDGNWFCFRNRAAHKGRRPHRLLMRLLGCSHDTAQSLLEDRSDFQDIKQRLATKDKAPIEANDEVEKRLPKISAIETHQQFYRYLEKRGYDAMHVPTLTETYDLRCALLGRFKNRIVFPIKAHGRVIGHTGRCVDNGKLRYLSHPGSAVKQHILWYDLLRKEHVLPEQKMQQRTNPDATRRLYVCEGPLDAMRLDYVARVLGLKDRATCLFTTSATPGQINELHALKNRFSAIHILLDKGALAQAMRLRAQLVGCQARITVLPKDIKDPGELSWTDTIGFLRR